MAINAAWHAAHPMPEKASVEERIHWHLAHAAACGCRPMPKSIRDEAAKRGLLGPAQLHKGSP